MGKTWRQVVRKIEKETEKIWLKEPAEITRLRMGIAEFDAGSFGQIFAVILNLNGETRSFAVRGCFHLLKNVDKPDVSLDSLKLMVRNFLPNNAETMYFLGIKKIKEFSKDVLDVVDQLESREEYKQLIGALYAYANRILFWVHEITPHGLGVFYPKWDRKAVERIKRTIAC
jgi:hypothetical protein